MIENQYFVPYDEAKWLWLEKFKTITLTFALHWRLCFQALHVLYCLKEKISMLESVEVRDN